MPVSSRIDEYPIDRASRTMASARAPYSFSVQLWGDKHPLHFVDIRSDFLQCHASCCLSIERSQQKPPFGRRILARQLRKLFFECLGIEIFIDELEFLDVGLSMPIQERVHKASHLFQLFEGIRFRDFDLCTLISLQEESAYPRHPKSNAFRRASYHFV
jgi:hypothetical protein